MVKKEDPLNVKRLLDTLNYLKEQGFNSEEVIELVNQLLFYFLGQLK